MTISMIGVRILNLRIGLNNSEISSWEMVRSEGFNGNMLENLFET
jgi:hypothetical protein